MRRLLAFLLLLFPALAVIPSSAQSGTLLYDNGLPCPFYCRDAWPINGGFVVSDTFIVPTSSRVTGFDIYTWEFPNDRVLRIQWSITSSEFGGTVYGSGDALVRSDTLEGVNEYGFDVDKVTVTGLNVVVPAGISWINLQNAVDIQGSPVYWDENSGSDCHWPGCPSMASESQVGTIPSESFDVRGSRVPGADGQSGGPEPTSGTVWGSVLMGLAALRRILL